MYYVYAHINPSTNKPFYIGKGSGDRYICKNKRNVHWNNIVKKYGFCSVKLVDGLTNEQSYEIEKHYIKKYGLTIEGGILCNKTLGGTGGNLFDPINNKNWNSGKKNIYSNDTLEKMKVARIGKKHDKQVLDKVLEGLKKAREANIKNNTLEVVDLISGKKWSSKYDCAKEIGITVNNVMQRIHRNTKIKGYYLKFLKNKL